MTFSDPAGAPWAMPLVFVVDKAAPASRTAILEASALATVRLVADPEPDWVPCLERWVAGRIRKVVRRAKPSHFQRTLGLPGVSAAHAGSLVRAFVPGPTDELPPDLGRLQVSGSEPAELGEPTADAFLTIFVNPQLASLMSVGKAAAQVSHASQMAWYAMDSPTRDAWRASGFSLSVETPAESLWAAQMAAPVQVVDAGLTELRPSSNTVRGAW